MPESPEAYLRGMDNALALVRDYAERHQDIFTIAAWQAAPETATVYGVGDFVLIPNPNHHQMGKFGFDFVGPFQIRAATASKEIFRLWNVTQDKERSAHAASFVPCAVTSVQQAREWGRQDYGEQFVDEILAHAGDPAKRSTLHLQVRWSDGDNSWLRWSDCRHVDMAIAYMGKVPGFEKPKPQKRKKKRNQYLNDYTNE